MVPACPCDPVRNARAAWGSSPMFEAAPRMALGSPALFLFTSLPSARVDDTRFAGPVASPFGVFTPGMTDPRRRKSLVRL